MFVCLCVAMICRHKCTGKETFTSRSDNTYWFMKFAILYFISSHLIQVYETSRWQKTLKTLGSNFLFQVRFICCVVSRWPETMLYNFFYKAKYIILLSITDGSFYVNNSNWYGTIVIREINSSYNNDNVI